MRQLLRKAKRRLLGQKDYALVDGSFIPAPDLRWCGAEFKDNSFYLKSAEDEARRLVDFCGCTAQSAVLDIGCGQGRLPIGLLRVLGECRYIGLDVDKDSIRWCSRYIGGKHPAFRFNRVNAQNERYNKKGEPIANSFRFDFPDKSFDIVYLYSVFSHMYDAEMQVYLDEIRRLLQENGKVFFTTFVEENVPNFTNNPQDYGYKKYSTSLHVVRYEKQYLFSVLQAKGFTVDNFVHRTEANGQSAIYMSKTKSA